MSVKFLCSAWLCLLPGYVSVAEEEGARVDDVGAHDLHLVGPDVPVGDGLVHHHFGVGVLGRVVIDVFCWNFVKNTMVCFNCFK